ncbi:conjugative relaxase [Salmonella enterica subsp. enterica serovar Hvittingfoss]|nr:conjugative relaxase [Salmonella enterica subsp. enterica serovar Hvittingfoss]
MIDITTITRIDIGSVVGYYADAKDDYYSKDSDFTAWHGEGAKALGLSGEVSSKRFKELLVGDIDTFTQMKRATGDTTKERLGYDLTFSAPKGVSMQALIHGDKAIIAAHEKAVAAAIREAETLAQARTTHAGKTITNNTGNLVVASFRHETSRALDPELHTHAFVMNMTRREDGQWRALKNDELIRAKMHLGDVYKQELALELTKAGYELRYNNKSNTFDMAHFTDAQVKGFSRRSAQIEAGLAAMGLDRETADAQTKSRISMATRDKKTDNYSREEIHQEWVNRANDLGIDFTNLEWAGKGTDGPQTSMNTVPNFISPETKADRAIQFALKSLSERDASFERARLLAVANKKAIGQASQLDIEAAYYRAVGKGAIIEGEIRYVTTADQGKAEDSQKPLPAMTKTEWQALLVDKKGISTNQAKSLVIEGIKSGRLKKASHRITTVDGIRVERSILDIEARNRGKVVPILAAENVLVQLADKPLKAEQQKSVVDICTTQDRFVAAHGFAGTGKSYMTMSAKAVIESQGYNVTALAPYGTQKKALEDEGMPARTIASFLKAKDKHIDEKSVVFIDEAGVIPAKQMKALLETIENAGARAVFLGDTSQTKAVEAGKPFEQLIKAGMQTSYMKDIQRQKNEALLEAVKLAAEGNIPGSLARLQDISEEKSEHMRLMAVAQRWLSFSPEQRNDTLIISGTNDSRIILNNHIRSALQLQGAGVDVQFLERVDSTQAERRDSKYYEPGQIIIPEKDYKNGLQRGESYRVQDTGPGNKLTVSDIDGQLISFSPRTHKELSVYSRVNAELAIGDKVMITRNDKELDVANGDRFTITAISDDKKTFTLTNTQGRAIELNHRQAAYLSYAYATTVHKAQGLTCDRVLFNIDTRSLTTSKDVFYVGISRARHAVEIFTNDKAALLASASRNSPKTTATEISRFLGMESRYRHINREYSQGADQKTAGKEKDTDAGVNHDTPGDKYAAADQQSVGDEKDMGASSNRSGFDSNHATAQPQREKEKEEKFQEASAGTYADYERYMADDESYADSQDYSMYEEYEHTHSAESPQHERHQHGYDQEGYGL